MSTSNMTYMGKLFNCVFLLIIWCFIKSDAMTKEIGPASIELLAIEQCPSPEIYKDPFTVEMKKINRTHTGISASYKFETPFDHMYKLNVTAAKWADGGWKENAFNYVSKDPCNDVMKNAESLLKSILNALGEQEQCPLAAGSHSVKDYMAPLENMFPAMLYGKFRVDIIVDNAMQPLLCFRIYLNSVKPKGKCYYKKLKTSCLLVDE